MAIVSEEAALAGHALELLRTRRHMVDVGTKKCEPATLGELEREAPLLVKRVLDGLNVVGPGKAVAIEGVVNGVVGGDGVRDSVGGLGAGEGEAAAGSGGGVEGVEVEVDMAVEVVEVDSAVTVKLWHIEVGVGGDEILEGFV